MYFEFVISVIIFVVLAIIFVCWQPARVVLKEVFSNPLKNSRIKVTVDDADDKKVDGQHKSNSDYKKGSHREVEA